MTNPWYVVIPRYGYASRVLLLVRIDDGFGIHVPITTADSLHEAKKFKTKAEAMMYKLAIGGGAKVIRHSQVRGTHTADGIYFTLAEEEEA